MTRGSREYFYESIADRFESLDHPADVRRRLSVVFDECLGHASLSGKRTLDAGCGYGPFSAAATARGATVVSVDVGPRLVARTMARAGSRGLVADVCQLAVRDESFDAVISSEMLEHTKAPARAVRELARVLRPNGVLVLTTPNRVWQGPVRAASVLRLRPFHGMENFVAWRQLEAWCSAAGLDVLVHVGFHPWPFQLGLHAAAAAVEKYLARGRGGRLMVNQALVARKR
ncbi:MAG TPA: methyltransferase domain-containing protein [Patescibacteria group bacterium]|nr:methyltransferase domain-containing protein [Patescibacteria group bacterium]